MEALDEEWGQDPEAQGRLRKVRRQVGRELLLVVVIIGLILWIFVLMLNFSYLAAKGDSPKILLAIALPLVIVMGGMLLLGFQQMGQWLNDYTREDGLLFFRLPLAEKYEEKGKYYLQFEFSPGDKRSFAVSPPAYEPHEPGEPLSFVFTNYSRRILDVQK